MNLCLFVWGDFNTFQQTVITQHCLDVVRGFVLRFYSPSQQYQGHVEHGQLTYSHCSWAGFDLVDTVLYCCTCWVIEITFPRHYTPSSHIILSQLCSVPKSEHRGAASTLTHTCMVDSSILANCPFVIQGISEPHHAKTCL